MLVIVFMLLFRGRKEGSIRFINQVFPPLFFSFLSYNLNQPYEERKEDQKKKKKNNKKKGMYFFKYSCPISLPSCIPCMHINRSGDHIMVWLINFPLFSLFSCFFLNIIFFLLVLVLMQLNSLFDTRLCCPKVPFSSSPLSGWIHFSMRTRQRFRLCEYLLRFASVVCGDGFGLRCVV